MLLTMEQNAKKDESKDIISKLFEASVKKINNNEDKAVLEGLRRLLDVVEDDMYDIRPQKMDAIFFPDQLGLKRLIKYLSMAKKSLKICVFNLTHNDLANTVLR